MRDAAAIGADCVREQATAVRSPDNTSPRPFIKFYCPNEFPGIRFGEIATAVAIFFKGTCDEQNLQLVVRHWDYWVCV